MALPFGTWPSLRYLAGDDTADLVITDYYVRTPAAGGNDVTGQGTVQRPFATPQRAVKAATVKPAGAAVVHLGSGTYTRPLLRSIPGVLGFVGDGGGDVGDDGLTVEQGPTVAAAGTAADTVAGGFVADSFDGFAIEFLDGAAAGERRTIAATTVTDLVPLANFDPAPAPGDTYRVVSPAVVFNGFQSSEPWPIGCGAPVSGEGAGGASPPPPGAVPTGIYLVNIQPDAAGPIPVTVTDSALYLYGVDATANVGFRCVASSILAGMDSSAGASASAVATLLGLGSATQYTGYAFMRRGLASSSLFITGGSSHVEGYLVGPPFVAAFGATVLLYGASIFEGPTLVAQMAQVTLLQLGPLMRFLVAGGATAIEASAGGAVLCSSSGAIVDVQGGDGVRVLEGAFARLSGGMQILSAAGNSVNAAQGGRVFVEGDPDGNWLGASADTRVSATETQPGSFYAAVDDTLAAAVGNGSIVTRVS